MFESVIGPLSREGGGGGGGVGGGLNMYYSTHFLFTPYSVQN